MSSTKDHSVTVTTSSGMLVDEVPAKEQRRQIQIQNLSETLPVHIKLGSGAATSGDYRIDPGVTYMFPYGVSYDGIINAIAVGGSAQVAVIEFYNE
jgi:hypothetical protein